VRSKIWILAASIAAAMGCGTAAHATCPSPFTVKDSAGTTQNVAGINDANNNCVFPNAITDGSGAANRAAVKAGSSSPAATDPALVVSVSPNSLGCAGASITNTTSTPVSVTTSSQIISGAVAKRTYICAINLVVGAADNVALVEGTTVSTPCDTGTAGMAGGATAATGWNLAANGGLTLGTGLGIVSRTATNADHVCLLVSSGAQVSGTIVWTQF
jgi:hypothetical protein